MLFRFKVTAQNGSSHIFSAPSVWQAQNLIAIPWADAEGRGGMVYFGYA